MSLDMIMCFQAEQAIGVCKIRIDHGRPNGKDRQIFGKIVKYDKVWKELK